MPLRVAAGVGAGGLAVGGVGGLLWLARVGINCARLLHAEHAAASAAEKPAAADAARYLAAVGACDDDAGDG